MNFRFDINIVFRDVTINYEITTCETRCIKLFAFMSKLNIIVRKLISPVPITIIAIRADQLTVISGRFRNIFLSFSALNAK